MKFASPQWLWALLIVPIFYLFFAWDEARKRKRLKQFADPGLLPLLAPELDLTARLRKARLWIVSLGLIFVAMARPQWGSHEETVKVTGLDILFVLDVSSSMETEDVVPSRLKKAKHVIKSIVEGLRGDRVGLVAFAAGVDVACPITTDFDYFMEILQGASPKMIPNQGTDIGLALEVAQKSLKAASEEPVGADRNSTAPTHALILISDGEDQEGEAVSAAKEIGRKGVKVYALGIGTQRGGPIPIRDEGGNLVGYKKDRRGQSIVSKFEPDSLMQIAASAKGRYWNVTSGEAEVEELLADIGAMNRTELEERRFLVFEDRFQYPLLLAIALLLLEMGVANRKKQSLRIAACIGLLSLGSWLGVPREAKAVPLDAYLENKRGLKEFQDGKIDDAAKSFGRAQALDPSRPESLFNQGVIQMQQGDLDSAVEAYEGAANAAKEKGDFELEARSKYNKGMVQAKKGNIPEAVKSYRETILRAQKLKDKKLEADARKNLQLLAEQQEKKSKGGEGKEDPNSKDQQQSQPKESTPKKGDDKNKQNQEEKGQGQAENEQQKDKDQKERERREKQKREFSSKKLSREDADRVMAELNNRERELQQRQKKKNGMARNNQNDW